MDTHAAARLHPARAIPSLMRLGEPHHRVIIGLLCLLCTAATLHAADGPPDGTHIPVPGLPGSLVICGGGGVPDDARQAFVELAGGADDARIVVIPTASADAARDDARDSFAAPWRDLSVQHVTVLHALSREQADDDDFIALLTAATGIWFSGGVQSRITERYLDTRAHEAMKAVFERGGVIGGTSAGAAVMSEVMIAGGRDEPELTRGLGFLPGAIVDQHFDARDREARLAAALREHPDCFGLGIHEGSALGIRGRRGHVVGESGVTVVFPPSERRPQRTEVIRPGRPIDLIALSRAAVARAHDPFPPADVQRGGVEGGTLMLGGGGRMSDDVMRRWVDAAGGADALVVVIPGALGAPRSRNPGARDERVLRAAGAGEVRILDVRTPAEADAAESLELLSRATGIWFSGGRQWRLVDALLSTKAHDAIIDVVKRGGAIGGSSAGATIQGEYLVRGHPLGNTVMMAEGYERGLGLLKGAAVDQHFSQRNRFEDLVEVKESFPQLLGIGLDEGTVIFVNGDTLQAAGPDTVFIFPTDDPREHVQLQDGDRFDLATRRKIE